MHQAAPASHACLSISNEILQYLAKNSQVSIIFFKKRKKIEVIESEAITFKVDALSMVQLMNDSPNNSLESLFSICKIQLME